MLFRAAVGVLTLMLVMFASGRLNADGSGYKQLLLEKLVAQVPGILKTQDPKTGRFGSGIWIVNDQQVMLPLAAAWATQSSDNPYYHSPEVLKSLMDAGDALIEDMDANGQWEFRKKDGSTWGKIHQPWTYSRWVRAYGLIKDAMPKDRRERWEKALELGYGQIAKTQLGHVHNIPTHHAMGLYFAGEYLGKPEWKKQSREFMAKVVATQSPGGYWSEHCGPVLTYGAVYLDALGNYYSVSKDESVLGPLTRAADFFAAQTYPDGSLIETLDERNPYHFDVWGPNVGLTYTAAGRSLLARQMNLAETAGKRTSADDLAMLILYGPDDVGGEPRQGVPTGSWTLEDGKAITRRQFAWFVCLSAFECEQSTSRWIQDRQNLISVFHDKTGIIVGGGNTKLQPLWSTFTVGDTSGLSHKPGDESPDFTPKKGLIHMPTSAAVQRNEPVGLELAYGSARCSLTFQAMDDRFGRIIMSTKEGTAKKVDGHLTLVPRMKLPLVIDTKSYDLEKDSFALEVSAEPRTLEHAGYRLTIPAGCEVRWPVLPHNPYRKDGSATAAEGRIVITAPFDDDVRKRIIDIEIL